MYTDHRRPKFLFFARPLLSPRFLIAAALALICACGATAPVVAQSPEDSATAPATDTSDKTASANETSAKPKLPHAPEQVPLRAPPAIRYVPGLAEPLVANGQVGPAENKDLDSAIETFNAAPAAAGPGGDFSDYAKPFADFIQAHPKSAWNVALLTNLGLGYYHAGYYGRAITYYEQAWKQGRDATTPQAHLLVDRAVGELAELHGRLGHDKELDALLKDIGKRPIGGPATELLQGAHDALWALRHTPETTFVCGPKALKNTLIALRDQGRKISASQIKIAADARSGPRGYSLARLSALADQAGLKHAIVFRKPGQPVPVPSIINWGVHHFAAITATREGYYDVQDPTFGDAGSVSLSAKAIDAESSGYFLVPDDVAAKAAKNGWRTVSAGAAEIKSVYGLGFAPSNLAGATMPTDIKMTDCLACYKNPANTAYTIPGVAGNVKPQITHAPQMTIADALSMNVSLHLTDTPVGYRPQIGIPAYTTITYNQREAEQPATFSFSNLSPKWSHSWQAYMVDTPGTGHEGVSVRRVAGGGGGMDYRANYSTTTGIFTYPEQPDNSILSRTPATGTATSYTRTMPDGSKEVYSLSNGAGSYPRLVFLTSIVDPQGNTTTLNYDGTFRLTSVQDSMGRSTTFTYGLTLYPLLITEITDAFSRTTQLTYDTSQRLSSITDPAGITSSFTYSATETTFVNALTTPYGTSTFVDTVNPYDIGTLAVNTRSLTLTDPLGYTDFLYFYQNANVMPETDPAGYPDGHAVDQGYLSDRNTYYWDRHAYPLGVRTNPICNAPVSEDFSKAMALHWLYDGSLGVSTGQSLGSIKPPLEYRIWLTYPYQTSYDGSTFYDHPSYVDRFLDDGTTQLFQVAYNDIYVNFLPETITDAVGRQTKYNYWSNGIDLNTVQQNVSGTFTTIATYGSYNTLHEPTTYTGPDGKVWTYTYTTVGQIKTIKDPNSNITTYNYDASGRLSTVSNANSQTVLTLTYDSADRIHTRQDSEGYTLTYAYDNLDRVTSITYPDSTTDTYDYTFQSGPNMGNPSLELRKYTDRLGRVTTYAYDADRRLTSVTEATTSSTTRTTSYDYYENGVLKDITDANGNVTHWDIDIESRPIDKIYNYGTSSAKTETYTYAARTSRLASVTDALGQTKTYSYDKADELTKITYSNTVNPAPHEVDFTWDATYPRLSTMVDGTGTTTYNYTALSSNGALKLSSIVGPYTNDTLSLTYDALGRLSGETITGGNETFSYDAINRLSSHVTPLGTFSYTYQGQTGQTTGRSVTNGSITVSTSWGYDTNTNDRRLISITNSGVTRNYTLGYGTTPVNVYDVMSITDTAATGHPWATQSRAYTYDYADRLLTASSTTPGNDTYVYDKLDNPTTWTIPAGTTNPTYNGANQVATWGSLNYSYDANGNLLSGDGVKTYKWDAENRLIEIDYVGSSAKSAFTYDGLGRLRIDVETASGGGTNTTRYMWCGSTICQERSGNTGSVDTVLRRYMGEGEYNYSTSQKLVYMPDQLNAVRDVLDAGTGSLVESYDYTPYGAVARSNGSKPTDFEYAGMFYHANSTLNLADTRVQDSATGRWLNRDPIREASNANLYAYAAANTTDRTDPSGLMATCLPGQDIGNPQCQIQAGETGPATTAAALVTQGNDREIFRTGQGCVQTMPAPTPFTLPYQATVVGTYEIFDMPPSNAVAQPGSGRGRYLTSLDQTNFITGKESLTGIANMPYPLLRARAGYTAFNGLPPGTSEFGVPGWSVSDPFLPPLKPVTTNFAPTGGAP